MSNDDKETEQKSSKDSSGKDVGTALNSEQVKAAETTAKQVKKSNKPKW